MKLKRVATLTFLAFSFSATVFSQSPSIFGIGADATGEGRKRTSPTEITSDTMDIQTAQNIAVFSGNVVVKDQELTITCDKMSIFLEDKPKEESSKETNSKETKAGKKISKILCEGNVVITRKYLDNGKEKEQQGKAGQAEYDLKEQKITLSDSPVLSQGQDQVAGDQITLFRESERVIIKGGKLNPAKLNISPESLEGGQNELKK